MKQIAVPNTELLPEVRRLIDEGRQVVILARGNSMLPFIRDGLDSVKLEGVKGKELRIGDILLCEISPGRYVLHRLIRVEGESLVLMGDGNLRGTERCRTADVIARAVEIIRPNGATVCCDSPRERRRARLWYSMLPMRRYLLVIWKRLRLNPL